MGRKSRFGHYLSDRESQLAHWRNRVGYSRNKNLLLQHICQSLNLPSIRVLTLPATGESQLWAWHASSMPKPCCNSMLRSIRNWNSAFILLMSKSVPNNGYYYLNNGKCMNSAKRLPGSHLALTIGELTEKIFATSSPYMSLMLN